MCSIGPYVVMPALDEDWTGLKATAFPSITFIASLSSLGSLIGGSTRPAPARGLCRAFTSAFFP